MKTYFTEISLSVLTAIFPGEPGLAGFITAKDDGNGGDNYSYKTCKAPVKSSPPTPSFLQAVCRFCHPTNGVKDQRCQSTENESRFTEMLSTTIPDYNYIECKCFLLPLLVISDSMTSSDGISSHRSYGILPSELIASTSAPLFQNHTDTDQC